MIAKSLIVNGQSRFINKAYFTDVDISGSATLSALSLSGNLSATGNMTVGGTLNVSGSSTLASVCAHGAFDIYGATPFIGFHFGNGSNYTSRIAELNSGELTISGDLQVVDEITSQTVNTQTVNSTNIMNTEKLTSTSIDCDNIRWVKAEEITVADLGGTFIVAPTVYFTQDATTVTVTSISGNTVTMTINDNNITTDTLGGHTWSRYSKVKLSGKIGDCVLGSSDGYLSAQFNASSKIWTVIATIENADELTANTTYSGADVQNLAMMMYAVGNGAINNTFKVGIVLTSYGDNYLSYMDIYGGTSNSTVTRVGNLGGISYDGSTLSPQWGMYTNNGYFTGMMNAQGGSIGASGVTNKITIGTNSTNASIYYGMTTLSDTAHNGFYIGADGIALGKGVFKVTNAGALTATSATITGDITANTGYIGGTSGWTITAQQISSDEFGSDDSMFLATKDLSGEIADRTASDWRFTVGPHFGVTNDGSVYADSGTIGGAVIDNGVLKVPAAQITGTLTADKIGAGTITADKLAANTLHIGGHNLLKSSYLDISNSNYNIANIYLVERDKPVAGETVTIQIKGTLASTKTHWAIYNSGGSVQMTTIPSSDYDSSTGIYTKTFEWKITNGTTVADNTRISIYVAPSGQSGTSSIEWVMLERGNQPSGWGLSADEIGGFTITNSTIYNGTFGASGSVYISTGYGSSTAIGGSSGTSTWAYTAGKNFGVTTAGGIYAASGKIGGWTLDASSLYTGTKTASSSIIISSANITRSINGISRTGLRLLVGSNFGVSNNGILYASSAIISGTLTAGANSQIGPWTVSDESIYKVSSTFGDTTSGAAYFGDDGLSIGGLVKIDADNTTIQLGGAESSRIDITNDKLTMYNNVPEKCFEIGASTSTVPKYTQHHIAGENASWQRSTDLVPPTNLEADCSITFQNAVKIAVDYSVTPLDVDETTQDMTGRAIFDLYPEDPDTVYSQTFMFGDLLATMELYYSSLDQCVVGSLFGPALDAEKIQSFGFMPACCYTTEDIAAPTFSFGSILDDNTIGGYGVGIGWQVWPRNKYSLSTGSFTQTSADYQAVFGKYNNPNKNDILQVGNGSSDGGLSNALELTFDGALKVANPYKTLKNLGIQCGQVSITVAANTGATSDVVFDEAFTNKPIVVCSIESGAGPVWVSKMTAGCYSVQGTETTETHIRVWNSDTASRTVAVNWIAIDFGVINGNQS